MCVNVCVREEENKTFNCYRLLSVYVCLCVCVCVCVFHKQCFYN